LSDDFGYCEACGKRITGDDFSFGDAVRKEGRIYCMDCYKQSSAETNVLPARSKEQRKPSTRMMPAHRGSRRGGKKKKRPSSRMAKAAGQRRRPSTRSAPGSPYKVARVQKLAVSIICPYCMEKLVVKVTGFPANHTCEICGKTMRVESP
jgi:hypothetical protein